MKKWFLALASLLLVCVSPAFADPASHEYNISPVPFTQVEVPDGFWRPRLDAVRQETIPFSFQKCEETGRISNFAKAGGLMEGKFQGIYFDDSDLYKVIEGAAYVLALQKDEKLDAYLDEIIAKIAAAQEPDGYLYTSRTIYQKAKNKEGQYVPPGGEKRWSNTGGHELYCVGHLYEAAYAHYLATGKRNLLDVALKSADLICETFGDGKFQNWPPGHQEIEIGLSKLYRLTGEKKYISLRAAFLNPSVLAVTAGLILYMLKAKNWLPDLVQDGFRTIGAMSTPLCMVILGIRLATMNFRKLFTTPLVWLISAGKLLVFPLFCYLLVIPFPFDPVFKGSILILAATPCASILLNLAEIHHNGQELAANCALLTTLLSIFTIPLLSLLL